MTRKCNDLKDIDNILTVEEGQVWHLCDDNIFTKTPRTKLRPFIVIKGNFQDLDEEVTHIIPCSTVSCPDHVLYPSLKSAYQYYEGKLKNNSHACIEFFQAVSTNIFRHNDDTPKNLKPKLLGILKPEYIKEFKHIITNYLLGIPIKPNFDLEP